MILLMILLGIVFVQLVFLAMLLRFVPVDLDAHTSHRMMVGFLTLVPDLFKMLLHGRRNLSLRSTMWTIRLILHLSTMEFKAMRLLAW